MAGIRETLARNVRAYRKRLGWTQEYLARRSGLHRTRIGEIERSEANATVDAVAKIAEALDVDPSLLFIGNEAPSRRAQSGIPTKGKAKAKGKPTDRAINQFGPGDYALCQWTPDGIVIDPIDVHNESLTISILCYLVSAGETDNLLESYAKAEEKILPLIRSRAQSVLKDAKQAAAAQENPGKNAQPAQRLRNNKA